MENYPEKQVKRGPCQSFLRTSRVLEKSAGETLDVEITAVERLLSVKNKPIKLWFFGSVLPNLLPWWGPRAHENEPFSVSETDSQIIVNLVVDEKEEQIVIHEVTDLR
jgi:hypothetical protein